MADRQAILVLGMHRSGTSAITRVLNILGAALPTRLLPETVANPVGHFESLDIVTLHDQLLHSAGTKWSDWSRIPQSWYNTPDYEFYVEELMRAVRENYGETDLFVVKDPRMARFVPVWLEVLSRLDVAPVAIVPYRNPIEVAQSLRTRDHFTISQGLLLWLRHCLDAEAETRRIPRCFIGYEYLVNNTEMALGNMIGSLQITWPRSLTNTMPKVLDFIDASLYRQKSSLAGLHHSDVNESISKTYMSFERFEQGEADRLDQAQLDRFRSDLDTTAAMSFAAFNDFAAEQHGLESDVKEMGVLVEQLRSNLSQTKADLQSSKESSSALEKRLAHEIGQVQMVSDASSRQLKETCDHVGNIIAAWQERQAHADAEMSENRERLRRITGRFAVNAYEAELRTTSRFRKFTRSNHKAEEKEEVRRLVLGSGLFDPDWYLVRHTEISGKVIDALDHYMSVGFERNCDPGPDFDAKWYLETNPDVRQAGIPPLVHFIQFGIAEGRRGRPTVDVRQLKAGAVI